jgi:CRP/FNR family transcriptional regulator, cyclic AMP receptor protein
MNLDNGPQQGVNVLPLLNGGADSNALDRWKQLVGSGMALQRCQPEAVLLSGNSPIRRSFLVEQGVVALTHHLSTGKQVFLALRGPGQIFGHCRHLLNHSFELSASALTHCTVRVLDPRWLVEQVRRGGDAGVLLMEQHAYELYESGATLIDLVHLDASIRLERFLVRCAAVSGVLPGEEMHLHLPLSDAYIACLLGISAQQFSTIKRKLVAEGKVRQIRDTQTWIISSQSCARAATAA